jgi:hypothetical protein
LFFEGVSQDCLTVPDHVRWLVDHDSDLSPDARRLGQQLFREHAVEFNELLVAAGLGVAQGMSAHLAGATWISGEGRPVMLVAAAEVGGDICDDHMLEFLQVFEEFREQYERGERSRR